MTLILKPLSFKNTDLKYYNILQEIATNDNGFQNPVYQKSTDTFKNWLQRAYLDAKGVNLPTGYVPQTTYWLLDNNFPVGIGRIKHFLTPQLTTRTGHIAYAVPKTKRGQGYGNQLFALLLQESQSFAINPIQVTAYPANKASNYIIQKHGGKLILQTERLNIYHIVV